MWKEPTAPRPGNATPDVRELAAHPRFQSRNSAETGPKSPDPLRVGAAEVDLARGIVRAPDGTETELRRQSAAVLRLLAARRGENVAKEALYDAVWGDIAVTDDSLVQCIGDIRRALGSARGALRTIPRQGYRLESEGAAVAGRPRAAWLGAAAVVLLILVAGWIGYRAREPEPGAGGFGGPTIAVLPFENRTGGERWDRLARGLTDEVIADLGRNPWLFVLAGAGEGPGDGPDSRRPDYVVRGSLQAEDDRVRIAAGLLDAGSGRQVWADTWEGPADALLAVQRQAAEALTAEIASNWSGPIARADRARARGLGTDNLEAYELYLLGAEQSHRMTRESTEEAIGLLRQAVQRDPSFGDAWAKLALSLFNSVLPDTPEAEAERLWAEGAAAAQTAYRVAPDSPFAIGLKAGEVQWSDPAKADEMYRQAAAIAPSNPDILAYLSMRGAQRPPLGPDADAWMARALELNPSPPEWYQFNFGLLHFARGRYAEAAIAFGKGPDNVYVHAGQAAALGLSGEVASARPIMRRVLDAYPQFRAQRMVDAFGLDPAFGEALGRGIGLASAPAFDGPVVAVLPFRNLRGGERWDRLARGLTEEVIASLARNQWLYVLADATTHAHADASPQEIAAKLGVGYVVRGGVQAEGGQVRIAAALIEAGSGRQVWSRDWQGAEGDLLGLQVETADGLAGSIGGLWTSPIVAAERARATRLTGSLDAYELYLLAMDAAFQFTPQGFVEARGFAEKAVAIDPGFGEAWAKLAYIYDMLILPSTPPAETARLIDLRTQAARNGLRFAPDSPFALINAAKFVFHPEDPDTAKQMIRPAASLAPNNADMLQYAAPNLAWRFPELGGEAEGWVRRAMALNPGHSYAWTLAEVLIAEGRYAEAAALYADAPPDWIDVQAGRAAALALSGDLPAARGAVERLLASYPGFDIGWYDVFDYHPAIKAALSRGLRLAGAPDRAHVAKAATAD